MCADDAFPDKRTENNEKHTMYGTRSWQDSLINGVASCACNSGAMDVRSIDWCFSEGRGGEKE